MVASSGSCRCGAVSLAIDMDPFLTYNCHCSHCRAFANRHQPQPALFHGAAAVWKWNVALHGEESIVYETSTALGGFFSLSRGKCSVCHQIIWESGERAIFPFAMVGTEPLLANLKPDLDIYYGSGLMKGPTGSKVIHTDLGSLLYEVYIIICFAIPSIPWSIWKRVTRKHVFVRENKEL